MLKEVTGGSTCPQSNIPIDEAFIYLNAQSSASGHRLSGGHRSPEWAGDNTARGETSDHGTEQHGLKLPEGVESRIQLTDEYAGRMEGGATSAHQKDPTRR
jgi:hypothetical protein